MKTDIKGVGVALVTPFNEKEEVDYGALERLVEFVTDGGVDYLVALGTTAETPNLSKKEKKEILEVIKRTNAGRLPMIVGVGGYSTCDVVESIKECDLSGVSGVLSVTPFYNRPSQEGLFRHFEQVAKASPIPVLLYNVPARTGVNMSAETTLRIAREVDNVMGVKEASGVLAQMSKILVERPEGFKVISGDDLLAVPLSAVGGDGVISVAANAFPQIFSQIIKAIDNGEMELTKKLYLRLFTAMQTLFDEGNPTGVKCALEIKGIMSQRVRLPLVEATDGLKTRLEKLIRANNL